ncbi:winged helix DNA-binding protein [Nanohaloarchaea archaeon]|nr:winged helix DNA-binding protein [Candidatus Nanohaloarchaea archaeon]
MSVETAVIFSSAMMLNLSTALDAKGAAPKPTERSNVIEMTQQLDLNKTEKEILESVYDCQRKDYEKKQIEISKTLNKDKSAVSRNLSDLEERDLIKRTKEGRSKRVSITHRGCTALLNSRSSASEKYNNLLHLHKFVVKFPIQNLEEVKETRGENWREKLIKKSGQEKEYNSENDCFVLENQEYTFWITRIHLVVFIQDLVGQEPSLLKARAINQAIEATRELEEELVISITEDFSKVTAEVSNQHIAIIRDPLSELIHQSDHDACEIKILDENGNVRLWLDDSDGRKDLEAGTQYGTHGFSEEDIEVIQRFYKFILSNPEKLNQCMKIPQSV